LASRIPIWRVPAPAQTTTFIAFLRGINVGGRHILKMERLRELLLAFGLTNVRTYIQSGNVFFETMETDRAALTSRIEHHLFDALGYEVAVFLRTILDVEEALKRDPFKQMELTPDTRLFIIFTSQPLPGELTLPLRSPTNDFEILQTTPGEAFVVARRIDGRPANPAAFIEKTFKVRTTSRFFGTAIKILQAAKGK
jgi:uncharacterized protein (DUF1697 family)